MRQSLFVLMLIVAGWQTNNAQDISKFKVLSDSAYQTTTQYQEGNKYQKDAILFMDMVADTHPYYIRPERREEWFSKKDALLEQCLNIWSDEDFVDALIEVLGPLHDKHTDLTTEKRLQEKKAKGNLESEETSANADVIGSIMDRHDALYDFSLLPEESICYLQFNQCVDAPEIPFEVFLDEMFTQMEEEHIKTLVVDAQYNGGGSSSLCDELLQRLCPVDEMKNYSTWLRFSDLMAAYNPKIAQAKAKWDSDGHQDELYQFPAPKIPADYQQPAVYQGKVVFVMGPKTYSSAGILLTMARDNHIGTIIGTTSTFSPSHYGEVLPYRLPNTGVLGSISCKFFARPDEATVDDTSMVLDCAINLDVKEASWQYIIENFGNK